MDVMDVTNLRLKVEGGVVLTHSLRYVDANVIITDHPEVGLSLFLRHSNAAELASRALQSTGTQPVNGGAIKDFKGVQFIQLEEKDGKSEKAKRQLTRHVKQLRRDEDARRAKERASHNE